MTSNPQILHIYMFTYVYNKIKTKCLVGPGGH